MLKEEELTGFIIKAYYKVYNTLGYGFLERVYHKSLELELRNMGLAVHYKRRTEVYYEGVQVGIYQADLVVNNKIIIEIKATEGLHPAHEAQLVNYLRATEIEIGFLFNFGQKPQFVRKYFSNERKSLGKPPEVRG